VGAIVQRGDRVLLVRRGRGAAIGRWSIPGGRVEFGEPVHDAVEREVFEETGLRVRAGRFAGFTERIGADPDPYHYVILDFFAAEEDAGATARAGDDADDVQWAAVASLGTIDLVDGLAEFLASAGVGEVDGRV
jgi:ADP-ribose pyrophosphatase YjhB (NUDIX family)